MLRTNRLLPAWVWACAVIAAMAPSVWGQAARTADEELSTFTVKPGYRVELVAAEPLVRDPIGMAFDADGRLWVVELQNYMTDVNDSGGNDALGTISVLEDVNGDGRMDRRTEFLRGLRQPRAVAFVEDGVLVVDAPDLWFCRDTNGDLVCDERTWVANYGPSSGDPENNVGSLTPALDNWIYSANWGTRIRRQGGQWVLEAAPARGQWGMSQDDRGRLFTSTNRQFIVSDRGGMMPPWEKVSDSWPLDGYVVWPGHPTPRINRFYWPGALRADGSMISSTATCGPVIYRGDNFPADARGNAFSCEPAGNLVRRMILDDAQNLALNAYSESEFLVSTDERFRPVNTSNGPDGCLYVVDMYKGVLQHLFALSNELRTEIINYGLEQPLHLGRIWRVVSTGNPPSPVPRLQSAGSATLVGYLSHANGHLRDTAQRLLVERSDASVVPQLQQLAASGSFPADLHAQAVLDGMGPGVRPPPRGNDVLLVYGYLDATPTLAPGDVAVKNRLESMGYAVELKEAPQSQTSDANGKVLVLISSTVGSDDVSTKFRDVAVPVIICEHAVFDDMLMTGPTYWTDFGYDENDPGLLTIVDPSSPLAGGLSGNAQVIGPPGGIEFSNTLVWATTPSGSAMWIAAHGGEPNKAAIFAYEAGAPMVGMNAPARRVGFFFYRNTAAIATSAGWALFDAAVAWAANSQVPPPPPPPPPPPGNAPPWVAIDAPLDGDTFMTSPGTPVDIVVSGRTTDPDGAVMRVEFYNGPDYVGYVQIHFEPPGYITDWSFTFAGVVPGDHTLSAVAIDNSGARSSTAVAIRVTDGAPPPPASNGFTAEYYGGIDFANLIRTQTDPSIDFMWSSPAPEEFSVIWTGFLEPLYSEDYTFRTLTDDGVRLWVDGQLLIDHWEDHSPAWDSGTIALTAGQRVAIRMEYYKNGYAGEAHLYWSSASQPEEVIPPTRVFGSLQAAPAGPAGGASGGDGGSCGATGMEAAVLLGLLGLFRRRNRPNGPLP